MQGDLLVYLHQAVTGFFIHDGQEGNEDAFYAVTGKQVYRQVRAIESFPDAPFNIAFDYLEQELIFVGEEFLKGMRMLFLHVEHQAGVHDPEGFHHHVHRQKYFMHRVFGPLVIERAAFGRTADFGGDHGIHQFVFIRIILVNGFFAHAEGRGDIIHAHAAQTILHEQVVRLLADPFGLVECSDFCHIGRKTMETFYVTKVSIQLFCHSSRNQPVPGDAVIHLPLPFKQHS